MRRILLPMALWGAAGAVTVSGALAMAATTGDLARLNVVETELSLDRGLNTHRLSRLLSVLELLKSDPPPALLVSAGDAKDAVRAAILVKAITPELAIRAQSYAQGATEVMRQRRLAAVQSEALFERDSLQADALPEPESAAGLRLRGAVAGDAEALSPPGRLLMPVAGPVLHGFGAPIAGGGRSNGLTLSAPRGSRAVSPGAGLVQYVGPVKGWDVIVILRLAGGYHLVLAGLERTSVQVGQSVAEGQPIGWVTQGRSPTSELYLEVREQGSPVDPAQFLGRNTGLKSKTG